MRRITYQAAEPPRLQIKAELWTMSADKHPENDDALSKVLEQWTLDASLPPRFQEQVWQRIAKETRTETANYGALWRVVGLLLPRPKFAYAYLAALLVTGVAAGSLAAQIKTTRVESELSTRYVQTLDPFRSGPGAL